jgi:hypothetical protein
MNAMIAQERSSLGAGDTRVRRPRDTTKLIDVANNATTKAPLTRNWGRHQLHPIATDVAGGSPASPTLPP